MPKARAIAFYLPQFHPIPENDAWWGRGFTEWTNVTKAKPLFTGHYQPQLPADLGFYDLRLPEVREAQANLARAHGVEGFCYWHYWFHGDRLLEKPVNEILATKTPDFPFCLAWANESWSRGWLGEDKSILIEQRYSPEDDQCHAEWLAQAFMDPRYIRVHGRPLFLIYRPSRLPDAIATTSTIREVSKALGCGDPYLVGINAHTRHIDMRTLGFDSTEDHFPQLGALPHAFRDGFSWSRLGRNLKRGIPSGRLRIYDYDEAVELMEAGRPDYPHFPGFFVGWDNTARKSSGAIVIHRGEPKNVARHFARVVESIATKDPEERIVFVNAWNEWAEGMFMEPDRRYGLGTLETFKRVLHSGNGNLAL